MAEPKLEQQLAVVLEDELTRQYGPMMTGEPLRLALGYPSKEALRQAFVRKTMPVPVFTIEQRRGKFALTKDVAWWLAALRSRALETREQEISHVIEGLPM